jgi:general secretion pathway protein C
MGEISVDRPRLAQTAVVASTTLAALALLGLVLAYWTWAWLAPRAEPRAQVAESRVKLDSAYRLFGSARQDSSAAAPGAIAIKLLGVASASGGRRGYAVVQLDPKQILTVREGNNIAPGVRVAEIHPDHIVVLRNGVRETLAWPEKNAAAPIFK